MKKQHLILLGYARSGVTIFNRVLSSDKRLICLSEINTRYLCPTIPNTPHDQVIDWYDLEIKPNTTTEEISQILQYCEKNNKRLIIRDWSFGSFVPLKYNDFNPLNVLNTVDDLLSKFPEKFNVIALIRNPIDIWLSMNNSIKTFHDKKLNYLFNFVSEITNRKIPYLKYEDFVENPLTIINQFYKFINLDPITEIKLSNKAIGDINYPESSRGAKLLTVKKIKRRSLTAEEINYIKTKTKTSDICKMLNYKFLD